jgi:hypothetical protein
VHLVGQNTVWFDKFKCRKFYVNSFSRSVFLRLLSRRCGTIIIYFKVDKVFCLPWFLLAWRRFKTRRHHCTAYQWQAIENVYKFSQQECVTYKTILLNQQVHNFVQFILIKTWERRRVFACIIIECYFGQLSVFVSCLNIFACYFCFLCVILTHPHFMEVCCPIAVKLLIHMNRPFGICFIT